LKYKKKKNARGELLKFVCDLQHLGMYIVKCLHTYHNKFNLELISSLKATANTKLRNTDNNDITAH